MELGREVTQCRMCASKELYEFLDLGLHPPSDEIRTKEELRKPLLLFPLIVVQCKNCGLTQLNYAVNPEIMYGERYKYESSTTATGKQHFFAMADALCERFGFSQKSLAVDIGSNVGVLLEGFARNGMEVLGIDPSPKIVDIANNRGIDTLKGLISSEIAQQAVARKGKAKIVTATNVFAHVDDKQGFIEAVKALLDEDGVFVIEVPYLIDLIEHLEYDTIYLEHLEYSSIKPLVSFFAQHEMEVFDVEKYDIHGHSVRVFVSHKGKHEVSENVGKFLALENEKGIYTEAVLQDFAQRVAQHKEALVGLLTDLKKQGKKLIGISSPAKGNTILNYCKIGPELLDYITEKAEIKFGTFTPGMSIPIQSEAHAAADNADYGVVFAWNFADEIIKNNTAFAQKGGKFIVPIPHPEIR